MGRGDVVSGIAGVAVGADLIFQPAAGTEVLITEVGSSVWDGTEPNKTPDISVRLTNGVIWSSVRSSRDATYWGGGTMKLFITNTIYLILKNTANASANLAYTGIQTK